MEKNSICMCEDLFDIDYGDYLNFWISWRLLNIENKNCWSMLKLHSFTISTNARVEKIG